jgi:hypothetical protein
MYSFIKNGILKSIGKPYEHSNGSQKNFSKSDLMYQFFQNVYDYVKPLC